MLTPGLSQPSTVHRGAVGSGDLRRGRPLPEPR
jgi:hypothetical protein